MPDIDDVDNHYLTLSTPPNGKDIDHLGFLGVSGMTAYFGMFDVGRLKDGETVCVSGAAGSVGLVRWETWSDRNNLTV